MAGLYVHIPFCHSKCAYCDFYSMPNAAKMEQLIDALAKEWELRRDEVDWSDTNTIYLGGGTPSIVPLHLLDKLIATFDINNVAEFTIEANPEDVTAEKAEAWRKMGINRISMGVQSLDDEQLRLIGRRHTATEAIEAVDAIKKAGFDNFSLDLIYGLPGQTLDSWRDSLLRLIDLQPCHLSAYMLSYEPGTRLTAMLKTGKVREADEETLIAMYDCLIEEARKAGYEHYEISNFAKPGRRAAHNSAYWDGTPYLGIGPSAHSYDGSQRRINPANLKQYLERIDAGEPAWVLDEENEDNRFNDMLITALRTAEGVDLETLPANRKSQLLKDAAPYVQSGDLTLTPTRLRFAERSWLISDSIMSALVQIG